MGKRSNWEEISPFGTWSRKTRTRASFSGTEGKRPGYLFLPASRCLIRAWCLSSSLFGVAASLCTPALFMQITLIRKQINNFTNKNGNHCKQAGLVQFVFWSDGNNCKSYSDLWVMFSVRNHRTLILSLDSFIVLSNKNWSVQSAKEGRKKSLPSTSGAVCYFWWSVDKLLIYL